MKKISAFCLFLLGTALPSLGGAPAPLQDKEAGEIVRFAVLGDFGDAGNHKPGKDRELDVSNLIKCWDRSQTLDFIITVGDNNYPKGKAKTIHRNIGEYYREFIDLDDAKYGPDDGRNRFWPTLGNHDYGNKWLFGKCKAEERADPYLAYFVALEGRRYYDFAQGPVHLFAVDSDCSDPDNDPDLSEAGSVQKTWLKQRLADATEPWKIVYFHHAPYSSGSHGSEKRMQWPFKEWGATIVLSGHEHNYERLTVEGFPYIIDGLGGKDRRGLVKRLPQSEIFFSEDNGALLVTASRDSVSFQFVTRTGRLIDSYTINAPGHADEAPPLDACPPASP